MRAPPLTLQCRFRKRKWPVEVVVQLVYSAYDLIRETGSRLGVGKAVAWPGRSPFAQRLPLRTGAEAETRA